MRVIIVLCLLALSFASPALAQQTERRVALVIGNAEYQHAVSLKNPGNDAQDVAEALRGLDFEVFQGLDLDHASMKARLAEFREAARDADAVLFYYAGHGFQADGRNYLLGTDAQGSTPEAVLPATVDLNEVLTAMNQSKGVKLVFLDACRDNPLMINNADQGLAQVEASSQAGFLISFSTQPNNVALDGLGRNSFFTDALLHHLRTPGQSVTDMMLAVRREVVSVTGGFQVPFDSVSLTQQFTFAPGSAQGRPEMQLFQLAAGLNSAPLAEYYTQRYPRGAHLEEAKLIANAEGDASSRSMIEPDEAQQALWNLARSTRSRTLLELLIEEYPEGQFALQARALLPLLPADGDRPAEWLCRRLATHPNDSTEAYPGVPGATLRGSALAAVEACSEAVVESPGQPVLVSLLARATGAAGDQDRAEQLFLQAAEQNEPRALFSLGLIYQRGLYGTKDPVAAARFYERAVEAGSADAMINLANTFLRGVSTPEDEARGIALMERAAARGLPLARFNLGTLALDERYDSLERALSHFKAASRAGETRGYIAAANIYDRGWPIGPDVNTLSPDPEAAADQLLFAVAEGGPDVLQSFVDGQARYSRNTNRALQRKLAAAGHYTGAIDGRVGPAVVQALRRWRNGGFNPDLLDTI